MFPASGFMHASYHLTRSETWQLLVKLANIQIMKIRAVANNRQVEALASPRDAPSGSRLWQLQILPCLCHKSGYGPENV